MSEEFYGHAYRAGPHIMVTCLNYWIERKTLPETNPFSQANQ